jgi:hypothetical protein
MVDNIHEIEPVVKKESVPPVSEKNDDAPPHTGAHDDPAQMKLEL